jgi:hypothetical protein
MSRDAVEGFCAQPIVTVAKYERTTMRHVQTITKTRVGIYEVLIWSSRSESDRSLACFMGPDAELLELVGQAIIPGMEYMECIERVRDTLEGVSRVTAYAVTDANGNGVMVELK